MRYAARDDNQNGLLHFKANVPISGYARYWPSPALSSFVEHYWTVEWNLPTPEFRETLPYPSAHLILEPGVAQLAGVNTRRWTRRLEGHSRVFGVKFCPGGLRPFVSVPVSSFTDRVLPLAEIFGAAALDLDRRVLAEADHHASIAVLESFLHGLAPRADDNIAVVGAIAARIAADRSIQRVEQLVAEFAITMRRLQRLFGEYVGVSPKWMIRRYRLQEAAQRLAAASTVDWSAFALDLGFADQAHCIREFKKLIGSSPAEYFAALSRG